MNGLAYGGAKVCYVGQPVAVVVAHDPYVARDAIERITVDLRSPDASPRSSGSGERRGACYPYGQNGKHLDRALVACIVP